MADQDNIINIYNPWKFIHSEEFTKDIILEEVQVIFPFNPLPDIPILGSSNSEANKDMMRKIWTNGDAII